MARPAATVAAQKRSVSAHFDSAQTAPPLLSISGSPSWHRASAAQFDNVYAMAWSNGGADL